MMNEQDNQRRAYGYTRVSTDRQVDGASLENQHAEIEKYAEREGFTIVGWYQDAGKSAWAKNTCSNR